MDSSDYNWPAILQNIRKARQVWGRLGNILRREGAFTAQSYRRCYCLGRRRGFCRHQWRTGWKYFMWGSCNRGQILRKKAEGRLVAEGGGGQSTSGSGDTTAPDILGQEAGSTGRMGGLTALYLRYLQRRRAIREEGSFRCRGGDRRQRKSS